MIKYLHMKNFKCFPELSIKLRPLTLLCGVNSSGKSSVIQAMLMGMEMSEDRKMTGNLDLMDARYNLDLYSFKELLYEDAEDEEIWISLNDEGCLNTWGISC